MFQTATRRRSRLRMTLDGPAGSGKTYTALRFAHTLAQGGPIAYIDTERGSASKYVGESPDGIPWAFDVVELTQFSPERYTELIQAAGKMGYGVLVIDSLSHAWEGVGGALDIKDRQGGNQWTAWRSVTPIHNRMVDTILQSPCHVITTMRSRMEYVQETDPNTGKTIIRKVGLSPIQRPGMEYEFDLVCDIDWAHILSVSKSRCSAVADMKIEKPGPSFLSPVMDWLESGAQAPAPAPAFTAPVQAVAQPAEVAAAVSLDDLVAQYGVEKVMEANGGMIPGTQEELALIAGLLGMREAA
ncbi:MAG: ATP-binding protein [Chloroflexota bacterium]